MGFKIKLNVECLKHIKLFQKITKASVKDCIINYDKILFIVNEGQAGLAIGKGGSNIRNLQRLIKKKIEVIEYADDLNKFLNNIFRPVKVRDLQEVKRSDSKRVVRVSVDVEGQRINPKAYVRGKIKKARPLLKKYFDIDDVTLG